MILDGASSTGYNPKGEKMKAVITGAEAVAHAVRVVNPDVISAYPITPQTHIIEKLAELSERGEIKAKFIRVEAEISAIAVVIGATAQGVRAFTATSSHGLLYMHELLHWTAGGRLPVVMAVANRAVGAPWNIWCDQQDMLSQRDTGWMQVFASSAQEAMDLIPISYFVAERTFLPVMVGLDGFILSHTAEPTELVTPSEVEEFLPPPDYPLRLSHHDPFTLWPILEPNLYHRQRYDLFKDHQKALKAWKSAFKRWEEITRRGYRAVETYNTEGAKAAFITAGAVSDTVKYALDNLFKNEKVGLVKLRLFRPFPYDDIREICAPFEKVIVLDRAVSYGAEGIFSQEIRSALGGACPVQCCVISMGGKDITPEEIAAVYEKASKIPEGVVIWS